MKKIFTKTILIIGLLGLSFNDLKAQYVDINNGALLYAIQSVYPSCVVNNMLDTTCAGILNATTFSVDNMCQCMPNVDDLNGIQYFTNLHTLNLVAQPITNLNHVPTSLKKLVCDGTWNFASSPPIPINLSYLPDSLEELTVTNCYLISAYLPALPGGLTYLNLANNKLTTLPQLPSTLNYLNCFNNLITSLPSLSDSMSYLNCEKNYLTSLPTLPNYLKEFYCTTNSISSLPAILPNGLEKLRVGYNSISTLPVLSSPLYELDCRFNNLTNLPNLPTTLKTLICTKNQISNLPNLPGILEFLYCDKNYLSTIPNLPNTLKVLSCNNNSITNLPTLSNNLLNLSVTKNLLIDLPSLPSTLNQLYVDSNHISCLPMLPNITFTYNFNITDNPITCVPNYVPGMNAATLALPLCQDNDLINNPAGCDQSKGILGRIYKDVNGNCTYNNNEPQLKNIKVNFFNPINNQFGSTYSISNGIFNYATDPGTYFTLIDTLDKPYSSNCSYPGTDTIVVTTLAAPLAPNVNFGFVCKPGLDLNVQSSNHHDGLVFPGQQHTLQVMVGDASQWYGLNCGNGSSGQVQITVTGPITYNGPVTGALTPTVNGNVYTYTIADFGTIDNETDFQMLFTTETTAQAGNLICLHIEVTPIANDINPTNNINDYCYEVVNSFDPNYKEVYPTDVPPLFQDWLTYTIHFQNLGTAPAINIRLLDTLDSNLDAETFEVINYSHFNTVTMMDGILDFRFPNILLPDSASDPNGSQGFVQYRIKPKANLGAGIQIENTAHIYFDYNPAVVTNTTINNFTTTVGNATLKQGSNMKIYPNPSTGFFTISSTANIEVYNLIGDLILSENNVTSIDLTVAPKGMYFVKLNSSKIEKLIKN